MGFFGTVWTWIVTVLAFLWTLFVDWLHIFTAPTQNLEMLWIIVPIYINWFFAEFFQEKEGTDFGNAISNGGILLWVGIDWSRYITRLIDEGTLIFGGEAIFRYLLALFAFAMGLFIVIEGIKAKQVIHVVGRIRVVTYVLLMFSPIVYGIIEMNWRFLLAIFLYWPVFYFVIEWVDRKTPDPRIYKYDAGDAGTGGYSL